MLSRLTGHTSPPRQRDTMPTGKNRKDQLNVRISDEGFNILYALQDYFGLSQSGVIELILREKAREIGFDPKNPKRKLGGAGQ